MSDPRQLLPSPKDKVTAIVDILGISLGKDLQDMGENCFKSSYISDRSSRIHRRAKRIRTDILDAVDKLLCEDDPDACAVNLRRPVDYFLDDDINSGDSLLEKNVADLAVRGNAMVSMVCEALLASSLSRAECNDVISKGADRAYEESKAVGAQRLQFGTYKFKARKDTEQIL